MTVDDLTGIIDAITNALQANKDIVPTEKLAAVQQLVVKAHDDPAVRAALCTIFNLDMNRISGVLTSLQHVLDLETKLVGGLTDGIVGGLQNLRGRPYVLAVLAKVLS